MTLPFFLSYNSMLLDIWRTYTLMLGHFCTLRNFNLVNVIACWLLLFVHLSLIMDYFLKKKDCVKYFIRHSIIVFFYSIQWDFIHHLWIIRYANIHFLKINFLSLIIMIVCVNIFRRQISSHSNFTKFLSNIFFRI